MVAGWLGRCRSLWVPGGKEKGAGRLWIVIGIFNLNADPSNLLWLVKYFVISMLNPPPNCESYWRMLVAKSEAGGCWQNLTNITHTYLPYFGFWFKTFYFLANIILFVCFVLFFIDFILLFDTYLDITLYFLMYISRLFTILLQFHYIVWFIYLFAKFFCRLICRFMKPVRSFTRRERLLCRRGVGGFSLIFILDHCILCILCIEIILTILIMHIHYCILCIEIILIYIDLAYSLLHTLHIYHIDHINDCIIFFSIILIISSNNQ